jgi:transcriptional regulator with XRE-family HTH domain
VERVVTLILETAPRDATHWSSRAMARQCGLSQSTVSRIWRAFSLPPHRSTSKLSPDPLFKPVDAFSNRPEVNSYWSHAKG